MVAGLLSAASNGVRFLQKKPQKINGGSSEFVARCATFSLMGCAPGFDEQNLSIGIWRSIL